MNNSQVAHAWAHGRSGKGSNLESDGQTLTSYWTPIATRIDGVIYISADNMSPSTSKHLSYARQAINHERENIFYTHAFQYGHRPALTHAGMLQPEAEYTTRTLERALAATRTRQSTKTAAIQEYMQKRAQLLELASRYNVTLPELQAIESTPEAITAYQEEKAAHLARIEAARVKAVKKQQKADKIQFEEWLQGAPVMFPASYGVQYVPNLQQHKKAPTDYITVKNDKVVTSQGAECPLDHAIKALKFWLQRQAFICPSCNAPAPYDAEDCRACGSILSSARLYFEPYKTNGHKIRLGLFVLDSIDEDGTVHAGCHTFTAAEIRRFINQWKEVLGL